MQIPCDVFHIETRLRKFFEREFEKSCVVRFEFYFSVVAKYLFEKAKIPLACESSFCVARLRPRIAEIYIYRFESVFFEKNGKKRGVCADKFYVFKFFRHYFFGGENSHVAYSFHGDKCRVRISFCGFGYKSPFSASYFDAEFIKSGKNLFKRKLFVIGICVFCRLFRRCFVKIYVKFPAGVKAHVAVFLFSYAHFMFPFCFELK